MKNFSSLQILLILAPFVISYALGLDIYLPILPLMAEIFQTSAPLIQLTMGLFLFTVGFGQLFMGPLSDRFGRKQVILFSSGFYCIGSLACALSPNIFCLIFSRFICAIGACGMLATVFAVVRDLYSNEESAKMFSFLNGAVGISPTFAPIIGGILNLHFGWQSIFLFLTSTGIISFLIAMFFLQETKVEIEVPHNHVLSDYFSIFSNRQFILASLLAGLADGILFCFFSISPFLIIEVLAIPAHQFGYYFACFGLVIAFGGLISGKVVEKKGSTFTIAFGILLILLGGLSMIVLNYTTSLNLIGFIFPMVIACTGAMFLLGSTAALALEPFGNIAGTASAAFGSMQFSISAGIGTLLMYFPLYTLLPCGMFMVVLAIVSSIILVIAERKRFILLPAESWNLGQRESSRG